MKFLSNNLPLITASYDIIISVINDITLILKSLESERKEREKFIKNESNTTLSKLIECGISNLNEDFEKYYIMKSSLDNIKKITLELISDVNESIKRSKNILKYKRLGKLYF